jgi:hypothetical protein
MGCYSKTKAACDGTLLSREHSLESTASYVYWSFSPGPIAGLVPVGGAVSCLV